MVELTEEQQALWEAVRPEPEPPADCQVCELRHDWCSEFTSCNHPDRPYNRGHCRLFKPQSCE